MCGGRASKVRSSRARKGGRKKYRCGLTLCLAIFVPIGLHCQSHRQVVRLARTLPPRRRRPPAKTTSDRVFVPLPKLNFMLGCLFLLRSSAQRRWEERPKGRWRGQAAASGNQVSARLQVTPIGSREIASHRFHHRLLPEPIVNHGFHQDCFPSADCNTPRTWICPPGLDSHLLRSRLDQQHEVEGQSS